ncbi:uncharacterized protein TrAtP1_002020 [Trichoderma atroviride]|uniref:uncharacterized protein n=1 Tax=Hypocrea atroviridis TaxID=63577 RepID=UPI0033218A1D|nr:hypothetical protein TrAtP1_002020 [Trichoderma atroviride]
MGQRAASSSSALPRFLLSLSASSTSSQQQLHGPPSPNSACPSTSQGSIELVAIRQHSWSNSNNLLTAAAAAAALAAPRVVRHKRASLSLPVVAAPPSSSTSGPEEEKIASLEKNKHPGPGRRIRSSTTSLACSTVSTTDSLGKGMTPAERQNKANQVWRGYW